MAVRRIAEEQPDSFVFSVANLTWAQEQIAKYPEGKQASAVIPLLWRAQEQHDGWLPEPAMRYVANILEMPFIRVLEVATFYAMYQLKPVGSVAHIQVCGTTPCMLRGSEDLINVCKSRISQHQHEITGDGKFSWEEVECLGACVNAPMIQVFKDTFEDLTPETFEQMLDDMENGREVKPGPQTDRHLSVNAGGRTQLFEDSLEYGPEADPYIEPYIMDGNAAMILNDAKSTGTTAGNKTKTGGKNGATKASKPIKEAAKAQSVEPDDTLVKSTDTSDEAVIAKLASLPKGASSEEKANAVGKKPRGLAKPRKTGADDLKRIKGVGKIIEGKLNAQGVWHFDQISKWGANEIQWFDTFLSFSGRIGRDDWVSQADILASGGETDFSKRVDKGDVSSSTGSPSTKPTKKAK